MHAKIRCVARLAVSLVLGLVVFLGENGVALAHGETARGGGAGGVNTVGAIVTRGVLSAGLRLEARVLEEFTDQQLLDFALLGEDVHQHSQEFSGFAYGSYAIDDTWSVHTTLAVNVFRNFREGSLSPMGVPELIVDDLSGGLGDLLLLTRCRFWHDANHHFVLLGGLKLPTGNQRETDNLGVRLGAHNQPGSGSIDFQVGAAYSLVVDWFELDADVIAHIRTEGAMSYQAGNLLQADVAASFNVWELTLVAELNLLVSERDVERDAVLANSGIATLYLSPGVVVRLPEGNSIYATFSYPIWQDLPGIQNPEAYRAGIGWSVGVDVEPHPEGGEHSHGDAHEHDHSAGTSPEPDSQPVLEESASEGVSEASRPR